jgi:outer membrane protein assembly factor BamD (BamD/ComL family)
VSATQATKVEPIFALRSKFSKPNAVATLRGYIEQWPEDENIPEARYLLAVTLSD